MLIVKSGLFCKSFLIIIKNSSKKKARASRSSDDWEGRYQPGVRDAAQVIANQSQLKIHLG